MKYALDALEDKALARPDAHRADLADDRHHQHGALCRRVRLAGLASRPLPTRPGWASCPSSTPSSTTPSRSTARASRRWWRAGCRRRSPSHAADGKLAELAPILTFQSVVDFTVSTRAIVDALYRNLPANGSELVLFDLNRNAKFGPLLRRSTDTVLARLLPEPPRNFRTHDHHQQSPGSAEVVERVTEAGATTEQVRALDLRYPRDVFSLSHLALPFPLSDSLYGMQPESDEDFGVNLGAMATRGERGTLIITLDSLARMSSNPFFPT